MDERAFQIQRMLADELDRYKGKDNIKEIQELYMNKKINQAQGMIENKEVILVRPYQVESTTTSSSSLSSFISNKIANLEKYMKFVKTPSQTRIFRPLPYYQSLKSRGEQDLSFWKEVATAFLDKKKNTDTARNVLWDAWNMNNFYFLFLLFSDFIGILFSFSFSFGR